MATTVPMLAPDGTSGDIPKANAQAAIAAGFKPAVQMTSPEGKNGYVPLERQGDAVKAGFKITEPEQPGFWENLGKTFGIDKNAPPDAHPILSAVEAGVGGPALGMAKAAGQGFMRETGELGAAVDALRAGNPAAAGVHAVTALPFVGPALSKMADEAPASRPAQPWVSQVLADATPGNAGTALGTAAQVAPMALGAVDEAAPGRPTIPNPPVSRAAVPVVRKMLAGDVNAPNPVTETTPAARYQAARAAGVQLDAADATGSPVLQMLKQVNRNSLTSSGTYDAAHDANVKALNDYTTGVLNDLSPIEDREAAGAAIQKGLLQHQQDLKDQATKGFEDLDGQLGGQPILGAPGVRAEARRILTQNAPYYDLHPELEPKQAMAIVRDLASTGTKAKPAPAVVSGFGPAPKEVPPAAPRDMTYSELHQLRSDLLDFNNNNPDLVKNQANGWIQRLAGAVDSAITSPRGSLSPDQVETFRTANNAWKQMKENYDSPQSPLYHAVRSPSPSTLVNGIQQTPEMAHTLQDALGPEGIGLIQRGVVEKALGTTKDGTFNFRNFQGQWNKLPQSYRNALFTPEQQAKIENIGQAGTTLNIEPNPSGTAKLGQKVTEAGEAGAALAHPAALAGTAAYHAAQFGVAKLINNPKFVDWLMQNPDVVKDMESGPKSAAGLRAGTPAPDGVTVTPQAPPRSRPAASIPNQQSQ